MHTHGPRVLLLCLLLHASSATAAIYRCTDNSGHITLSDSRCPDTQQEQQLQAPQVNVIPPPPPRPERSHKSETPAGGMRLISTGQQSNGCGDVLGARERRRAMVEKRIYQGMPQADVERALGKPDRISGSDNRTRYHYEAELGQPARTVTFDENGCVSGRKKGSR